LPSNSVIKKFKRKGRIFLTYDPVGGYW